jgi:pSer/pThr/pTyr-binding forkhead associated (FHA) protein
MTSRGLTGFFRLRAEASDFELVVLDGADEGSHFALDAPELLLGRGDPQRRRENEILLTDPYVSSRQAMLRTSGGRVEIEHFPSATNATLVNGRPVTRRPLRTGDRISVGRSLLELRAVEARAEAEPETPAAD